MVCFLSRLCNLCWLVSIGEFYYENIINKFILICLALSNMRPYFKNDLYNYALLKEQTEQRDRMTADALTKNKPAVTRPKKELPVDDTLTINISKQTAVIQAAEQDEDEQVLKSFKRKQNRENRNILANSYKPKSNLTPTKPVAAQSKTDKQQRLERKQYNFFFKDLKTEMKVIQHQIRSEEQQQEAKAKPGQDSTTVNNEHKKETEKKEQIKQGKHQNKPETDSEAEQKEKTHKSQKTKKTKFIKKQANYVRLDLKRKYKDRFVGAINSNIRRYGPNGRLKMKYRGAQTQLTMEDGELYNIYISSISRALCTTICLDQDSDDGSVLSQKQPQPLPKEWTKQALTEYLQRSFGFQGFREGQYETISNILHSKSTVFISETASGKSLTYIMSSMLLGGLSLVISPLVSLMLDQLSHLPDSLPAACISSLLNHQHKQRIVKMVQQGKINLLFLTPECLQTDFVYHLQDFPDVNFTCIDQAHSLSELSHNFRTSFLALGDIVQNLIKYKSGTPTILGLTATANPQTVASIRTKLNIHQTIRSTRCLNKNLYVTISRERGMSKCESLIRYLNHDQIVKCKGILIYSRTRKIMNEVLNYITNSTSFRVAIYHSALTNKEKTETLNKFREGQIKIVVATVALGMGLDFSDLECVIHMNMPKSIENYVQEIGRAGRREKRAYCHLFLDQGDYFTERNYIIADEIEPSVLQSLYMTLREDAVGKITEKMAKMQRRRMDKQWVIKTANQLAQQQEIQEQKPGKQEQQGTEVVKRSIFLQHQSIKNEIIYEEDQDNYEDQSDQNIKVTTKLFHTRVAKLTESTQLRQEALLTLLLKIESILKNQPIQLKVLPIAHQTVKIGFFKNNEQSLKKDIPFLKNLMAGCKKVKGTTYINLIEKCNSLALRPIYLLTQLYRLGHQHFIKIEQETPVFVWQFQGYTRNTQANQQQELTLLVLRGFHQLLKQDKMNRVISEMNQVQNVSLLKLNTLYSLAFTHSRNHIHNVLAGHIIPPEVPIPLSSISSEFDSYFKDNLHDYYNRLTDNEQQVFIPSQMILAKDIDDVFSSVALFMKHEMGNMDVRNDAEVLQARKNLIAKYRSGKVITKIFMGINSGEVTWKIYGQRSYWMLFRHKNYSDLLQVVRDLLGRYEKEYRDRYTSKKKKITFDTT